MTPYVDSRAAAEFILRHHLIWADGEASCSCGWSDLSPLYGFHLLGLLLGIEEPISGTEVLLSEPDPGSDAAPLPPEPGPEPVAESSPVEDAPSRVGRGASDPPAERGHYAKPYTSEEIADYYRTHSKADTAVKFGISQATVARRVKEWEDESGATRRAGMVPHQPLRIVELPPIERAPDPPVPAEAGGFEERRKEAARAVAERTWQQRHSDVTA